MKVLSLFTSFSCVRFVAEEERYHDEWRPGSHFRPPSLLLLWKLCASPLSGAVAALLYL